MGEQGKRGSMNVGADGLLGQPPSGRRCCTVASHSLLEAILFPLVEQVRLGAAQVDDLWAAVSLQWRGSGAEGGWGVSSSLWQVAEQCRTAAALARIAAAPQHTMLLQP